MLDVKRYALKSYLIWIEIMSADERLIKKIISELLQEVQDLRGDVNNLREDVRDVKSEVTELRQDTNKRFRENNKELTQLRLSMSE